MMLDSENMFKKKHNDRKNEQEKLESQLLGKELPKEKKIRVNIMLPPSYHERLKKAAAVQHVSASHLILTWIDEHCD